MSKKASVPDAWDDDWEAQADNADEVAEKAAVATKVENQVKISKAERLARHADENKKLWASAESPETPFFLAARDTVPLKSEFKPALKVLSRKPAPKVIARHDPVTGLAQMTIEDDDDEDETKKVQPTPEELRQIAERQRVEKQKRYDEARARIMGTGSGASTPGTVTPPSNTEDSKPSRGKSRGRGGHRSENSRPSSQTGTKELYDPTYTPKSGHMIQKRNGTGSGSGRSTPRDEEQTLRAPKGPEGNGRGFGFANRGGKTS